MSKVTTSTILLVAITVVLVLVNVVYGKYAYFIEIVDEEFYSSALIKPVFYVCGEIRISGKPYLSPNCGIVGKGYMLSDGQWRDIGWVYLFIWDGGTYTSWLGVENITELLELNKTSLYIPTTSEYYGELTTYHIYNYRDITYTETITSSVEVKVSKFNDTAIKFDVYVDGVRNTTYIMNFNSKILAYIYAYRQLIVIVNASRVGFTMVYPTTQIAVIVIPREAANVYYARLTYELKELAFKIALLDYSKYIFVEAGKQFKVWLKLKNIGTIDGKVNIYLKDHEGNVQDKKENIEFKVGEEKKIELCGVAPTKPGLYTYRIEVRDASTGQLLLMIVLDVEVPKPTITIPTWLIALAIVIAFIVMIYVLMYYTKKRL